MDGDNLSQAQNIIEGAKENFNLSENAYSEISDNYGSKSNSLAKNMDNIFGENEENNLHQTISSNSFNISNINFSSISQDLRFLLPIYFTCSNCNKNFSLKFNNFECMTIECGCKLINNCTLQDFINKYSSAELNKNFGCNKHENKKYIMYCKDCKDDLCEECLKTKALYNNDSGKHTEHETHDRIDLLRINEDIIEIKKLINKENYEKKINLKNLILNLIEHYDEYPSYNAYKTIKISLEFLSQPAELKKINSIKALKENINFSNLTYKIEIDGSGMEDTLENLDIFQNKKFNNLKKLQMNNIKKLTDIKGLLNLSFPKLKKLIIGCSDIIDDSIDIIKTLKLPKIKFISFFGNKITSPEIFGSIKNFKTLEKFYIGSNPIDIKKLANKNIIYNFPPSLIELGISNNFTKETNHFIIDNLNLENIKLLYVSGNGITSLKQFEKVKFKQLEEFWIRGNINKGVLNSIEDIKYLQGKENIKKIVLKQNRIKDIEKLDDVISLFPNLELLNLEDNNIKNEEIKNKVKKKYKKLKILI